jgi:serine/threonine protein kinase
VKSEFKRIERNLAAIRGLTGSLRNSPITDLPAAIALHTASPFLDNARWMALATLEVLLEAEMGNLETRRFTYLQTEEQPPAYWTRGAISEGVLDSAIQHGILSSAEKEILIKKHTWKLHRDENLNSLLCELEQEVGAIERILSRCKVARRVEQRTRPTPIAIKFEQPKRDVNEWEVRDALETRFKGSLEKEIEGTLGKILIFQTQDNASDERIAVKTIDPQRIKSGASFGALERFVHEVRHWMNYRHHPLVLFPFFTAVVKGWPYVAMPYCECTLRHYIDQKVERRGNGEAVAMMVQAITALEYATRHGLLAHQDLKPENILLQDIRKKFALNKDYPFIWRARLADFGLANAYKELKIPYGSRPYQAPEQYERETDLSRVDVFACGVMLHEVLSGLHPIGQVTSDVWPEPKVGESQQWKRENKWKHWARSPKKLCPESVDQLGGFREIIEESLRTDPKDRPSLIELQCGLLFGLKRLEIVSYENLNCLLSQYHFQSIYSAAISDDEDLDRYQLEHLETLTHSASE